MQTLPKLPGGVRDLPALGDEAKLAAMPVRVREALVSFRDDMLLAMTQKRYSAIVLDTALGIFESMFAYGLVGPDGIPGNDDDFYRRRPGFVITQPKAIRPLVGFVADSPYAFEAR